VSVCLDAWAILAWVDGDEPARERVQRALDDRPVISWINGVEVYYRTQRDHGRRAADELLADLRAVLDFDLPGVALMLEAARLKAELPLALGDCFAIATAAARGVPLLTGDAEILDREGLPCGVEDLRA
jgi:predicted nucleic acid-binding protein